MIYSDASKSEKHEPLKKVQKDQKVGLERFRSEISGGARAADFIVRFAVQKKSPQISKISKMVQRDTVGTPKPRTGHCVFDQPVQNKAFGDQTIYRCPMLIGWLSNEVRSAVAEPIGKQ